MKDGGRLSCRRFRLQSVRKNGLTTSVLLDIDPFMSSAAARAADVVSLEEYRRSRGAREAAPVQRTPVPSMPPVATPVWVYWVPVWIW